MIVWYIHCCFWWFIDRFLAKGKGRHLDEVKRRARISCRTVSGCSHKLSVFKTRTCKPFHWCMCPIDNYDRSEAISKRLANSDRFVMTESWTDLNRWSKEAGVLEVRSMPQQLRPERMGRFIEVGGRLNTTEYSWRFASTTAHTLLFFSLLRWDNNAALHGHFDHVFSRSWNVCCRKWSWQTNLSAHLCVEPLGCKDLKFCCPQAGHGSNKRKKSLPNHCFLNGFFDFPLGNRELVRSQRFFGSSQLG